MAVFSVATARIALQYLSYLEIVYILCAVALSLVLANVAVNKWRSKHERRLAAILLSLNASEQQAALDEIPEEVRKRVLKLMEQMAPNNPLNRTRADDARSG